MCSNEREPLGALRDAVAALAAEDVDGLSEAALARDLPRLRRLVDGMEAQWLRRLEAFDRRGGAAAEGAVSTGAWVRSACRLAAGPARGRVELARALAGLPDTAAALAAGDISPSHAELIAAALAELAEAGGAELAAETEPALVDLARAIDPGKLRRELVHVRHALAPEADADAAERAYERRGVSASQTLDGVVALDGTLDPEGGALLLAALQPLAAPAGEDDRRTPRQRRADALVELARRQLDHGDLPTTGGERPHMTVLVPLDTLLRQPGTPPAEPGAHHTAPAGETPAGPTQHSDREGRTAAGPGWAAQPAASAGPAATPDPGAGVREPAADADAATTPGPDTPDVGLAAPVAATAVREPADRADAAGKESDAPATAEPSPGAPRPSRLSAFGPRTTDSDPGAPRPPRLPVFGPRAAETGWAGPITGEAARRIACDAGITRVITDGPSQPLDVGRRTRTIPPALRTALVVRDRGCVFPGCDRPPPWTDAHHLTHWADGGPTSLDNLALLCRRHHRTVHERRWQLTRGPDGQWTATPPGRATPQAPQAA
jgi:Domain of unknown function (DUF222)/HNH endonuclease